MVPQEMWLVKQREWLAKREQEIIKLLTTMAAEDAVLGPRDQLSFSLEIIGVADVISRNTDDVLDVQVEEFFTRKRFEGIGVNRNVAVWAVNMLAIEQRKREDAGIESFSVRDFLAQYTHNNLIKRYGFNDETVKAICALLETFNLHLKHY